ncbi:LysR family transcriptional regulator [Vibrio sp. SCSIO 43136]|uniref:LysR family transcriptional regulator n=1 Tax=Vibrio sp. SCSIO 43136 TaxID=2819101 RepID=UPI002075D5EA|nr:LysR family transcriptional regulator [Vibrio sp. SCSIO 43136]USD67375.1 LysR family transcriptional regulator [Vibrio sp. SCSIO 43136]
MPASLEQLRAFVATVDNKGMAQAARHIGKHVSTVREQLNNLEIDTGLELFIRHPRSLEVTPEGEQLYKSAVAMLKEAALFDANVDSILQGVPDKLTIAIDSSLMEGKLDTIIAHLANAYPHMSLKLVTSDTMQIQSWIISGIVDIGLIFNTLRIHDELTTKKAYSFGVQQVVPTSWELPEQVNSDRLNDKLQISLSFLSDIGMRSADVTSHRFMLCNNAIQTLNLIKAGVGWASLPGFICQKAIEDKQVRLYQSVEDSVSEWTTNIVWQKQKVPNPAMKMFIDEVQRLPKLR